uniref:Werner Syndrome-like exonuclease n=1 Tax=Erigeron canadensis TaxID=72917 RepID=UPI001CB93B92|nr:Werner Syndrome-like exonuclease [Erigeron canadensis]
MATTSINKFIHHGHADTTHTAYQVTFFEHTISTLVTHTPSHVDIWITQTEPLLRHTPIIGLDIEWRPDFQNPTSRNPVATLQLCVGRRCLVYQMTHSPFIPNSLKILLKNPNYTFTGVGVQYDVQKLNEDYGIVVAKIADVRELAAQVYGNVEFKNAGIKTLGMLVLRREVEKPKSVTLSRWDDLVLSAEQVKYACIDAFLSFEIGRVLISHKD